MRRVGRLITTVDGSTTRRYAYDADTNRCGLAASCQSAWVYDSADRITASPYASAYTYDSHGNLTATTGTSGNPSSAIGYDANDHATVVNDGTSTVTETLSPSGRVLRRVVTTNAGGAVTEDISYGYSSGGDSPAYSRPTAGGTITTYLMGLSGLTDVGGTGTWSIYDSHGDVQGTTDGTGTFTAVPTADEFGVGTTPVSRLGWLGQQQRPSIGWALGLVRMGVRLYDPRLGRFLEVDPIEGGSANDYDYVNGDPVNGYDLAGTLADNCAGSKTSMGKCIADRKKGKVPNGGLPKVSLNDLVKVTVIVTGLTAVVVCTAASAGACGAALLASTSAAVLDSARRNHIGSSCSNRGAFARDVGVNVGAALATFGFSAGGQMAFKSASNSRELIAAWNSATAGPTSAASSMTSISLASGGASC